MKKELLDVLCCPSCKGNLELEIKKQNKNEIISGTFNCTKCKKEYKINEGIPNLLI